MSDKLKFLPPNILNAISQLDFCRLFEIRLRANQQVSIWYNKRFVPLLAKGNMPLICTQPQIAEIVLRAAEFSIYAVNSQLCGGFITIEHGIRIGLAGEVVYENDKVKTLKNFSSVVIRIPHEILGCSQKAYSALAASHNKNMLVISPPGCGKTTILRDLAKTISDSGKNVLLVDERYELSASQNGTPRLNVGQNTDVIAGAKKNFAFTSGIRALRPDYIITDELMGTEDIFCVKQAIMSGVNVIASIHAADINDLISRADFENILANKLFGRYVVLRGVGEIDGIFDQSLNCI